MRWFLALIFTVVILVLGWRNSFADLSSRAFPDSQFAIQFEKDRAERMNEMLYKIRQQADRQGVIVPSVK